MTEASPQRAYRAACPGCGASVDFRSAQSSHAVCGYCHSTVVRQGDVLARVGKMAELFEDASPVQLLASGQHQGQGFTVVGRLQYRYAEGTWNEWVLALDAGGQASLSEDNGAYVWTQTLPAVPNLPAEGDWQVGTTRPFNGQPFVVSAVTSVALISGQGELPALPPLNRAFTVVELRDAQGTVLSVNYGRKPPELSAGREVTLDALAMKGLRDEVAKDDKGRQFACPSCGAPVTLALDKTQSVTCAQCHALIDVSHGLGGELHHAMQAEAQQPLLPLGRVGRLQGVDWQVVGFQARQGVAEGERFEWQEYLLYNRQRGFQFLVDADDGWSLVKPATGAPVVGSTGRTAKYLGTAYDLKYSYDAQTLYVAGEFYWQVQRGQRTHNRDYAAGASQLSMEQSANELVWSVGSAIDAKSVAQAFQLTDQASLLTRGDVAPTSLSTKTLVVIALVVLFIVLIAALSKSDCDPQTQNCSTSSSGYAGGSGSSGGYRSSGGSYGGYSSGGGGHK